MPETRFPITYAALSPRTRKQFFRAVVELEAGLTTGEIANARFMWVKDALSLVLDYAWGEVAQKPYRGAGNTSLPPAMRNATLYVTSQVPCRGTRSPG